MSSRSRALYADSDTPHGRPSSAPYSICRRTTKRLLCSSRLPAGARITRLGIRYSNIDPDHETSAEPLAHRRVGASEPEPVPRRHVALGDRDEARQARLGGEQVVTVGIETAVRDPIPDRRGAGAPGRRESRTPSRRTFSSSASPSASRRPLNERAARAERSRASTRTSTRSSSVRVARAAPSCAANSARRRVRISIAASQRLGRSARVGTESKMRASACSGEMSIAAFAGAASAVSAATSFAQGINCSKSR